ncbi:MAG: septum formation protein Maf [Ignavibacteria bacterium]|nr:septum formation protein Maf [Ignavibacteria bacterium]
MDKGNLASVLKQKYILASKSPRRIQLLKQIGLKFTSVDSKADELEAEDHHPVESVKHNSLIKSRKVAFNFSKGTVIGADTIVVLDKKIINKPKDSADAVKILKKLSGKRHFVYTGINIINIKTGDEIFDYEKTSVYFRKLADDEINYYVKKYKPLDKAGAYGIQDDFGCLFIEKIEGDYYNIVGLPLVRLYSNLKRII